MSWIIPAAELVISGAGLFSGMGSAKEQKRLMRSQRAILDQQAKYYAQYMPQVTNTLAGIVRNPYSVSSEVARRRAEGDIQGQYTQGLGDLTRLMRERGFGDSSLMSSGLLGLSAERGRGLAGARTWELEQEEARKMQALQALGALVSPMGGQAAGGYSTMAGQYGAQASSMAEAMGEMWRAYSRGQYQQGTPTTSAGATTYPSRYDWTIPQGSFQIQPPTLPRRDEWSQSGYFGR